VRIFTDRSTHFVNVRPGQKDDFRWTTRVARFFMVKYTKIGNNKPNCYKINKWPLNLPNGHKMYEMAIKCTKWPHHMYSKWPKEYTDLFHSPKIYPNWYFLAGKYTIWQPRCTKMPTKNDRPQNKLDWFPAPIWFPVGVVPGWQKHLAISNAKIAFRTDLKSSIAPNYIELAPALCAIGIPLQMSVFNF
jgi:hypothetical protein